MGFFVFCFVFGDRVSLYSCGYLRAHYIDQLGTELTEMRAVLPPKYKDYFPAQGHQTSHRFIGERHRMAAASEQGERQLRGGLLWIFRACI